MQNEWQLYLRIGNRSRRVVFSMTWFQFRVLLHCTGLRHVEYDLPQSPRTALALRQTTELPADGLHYLVVMSPLPGSWPNVRTILDQIHACCGSQHSAPFHHLLPTAQVEHIIISWRHIIASTQIVTIQPEFILWTYLTLSRGLLPKQRKQS